MKLIKKAKRVVRSYSPKKISAPVIILAFGIIGIGVLMTSKAAIPTASVEAENGGKSGNACVVNTPNTSNNNVVAFGKNNCSQDGSAIAGLARAPWEGGPAYWKASNGAQFAKADAAGWDDPSFFPITVFFGKPDNNHVAQLKNAGINVFAPSEHEPPISTVTGAGIFVIAGGEWWDDTQAKADPKMVGYFLSDECEMGYSGCNDGIGSKERDEAFEHRLNIQRGYAATAGGFKDGRFLMANFGNGILRTFWGSDSIMSQHQALLDVSSADKYTYTSPGVWGIIDDCTGNTNGLAGFKGWHNAADWPDCVPVARAYSYGWQADQIKRFQNPNKPAPVWTFVETARPLLCGNEPCTIIEPGSRVITPEQTEGAVWSALIHEARGISYFQHNNNNYADSVGCKAGYAIAECPSVNAGVKKINDKVKSLAPVINTQSYYNKTEVINGYTYYRYDFNNNTDTMLKSYNGSAYIFAGLGMDFHAKTADGTGTKTFTLPSGIKGTSVEVVGENRTLPITNGQFSDTFPQEYTHHVYRININ